MDKYVILPGCGDLNRGDQALVWETIDLAKKAGFKGDFFMLAENESMTQQSRKIGISILEPILKHPSRKFKSKENTVYNKKLILKWGTVAIIDFIKSLLFFNKFTRPLILLFVSDNEKQTLKTIRESKACFVKGGGFIHSAGRLTDSYIVYYQLFHIFLAHSLGKPVYIMPNSFGPFKGIGVKWLVRKALKKCKLVTVRESISQEMLREIGIDSQLYPDLGFGLRKSDISSEILNKIRKKHSERKLVAITARPYRFPGSASPLEKYNNYVNEMVKFSKWLYQNNYFPVFVEHTLSETTHENDGSCITEIVSKLNNWEYSIISNRDYTCRDLKAIYSMFDFVVGTRFHSVIFSLSEGVPSIAITYGGNKGQGIMNDLDLSEYAVSIWEFSSDKIIQAFKMLNENRETVGSLLNRKKLQIENSYLQLVSILQQKN